MKTLSAVIIAILLSGCVGPNYDKEAFNPNCMKPEDFPACPAGATRKFEYASASRIKRCVWKSSCIDKNDTFRRNDIYGVHK